jgi:cellulose synthase/poly-beta-1,6-N-acetylglucosamine synthase-like glycosyltransferase
VTAKPLVSILINNFNYAQFLPDAIDSALAQTYSNVEVIVVDDGSTDDSHSIIASYGDRIIAISKPNGGQASAFNTGFVHSRGEIICFLDADDTFGLNKAADLVDAFSQYPEAGWCFHPLQLIDQQGKSIDFPPDCESLQYYDLREKIQSGQLGEPFSFPIPATSGMVFHRRLMASLLPMPEAETIALNDSYLKFVAIALTPGITLTKALAQQRIHSSNAFTLQQNIPQLARIHILLAYWMRVKCPSVARFTNNLFSTGITLYWQSGGVSASDREVIHNYRAQLSMQQRVFLYLKSVYAYLKTFLATHDSRTATG